MTSLLNQYKSLPQKTKNYLQLGGLVAAMAGLYYRDKIMEKVDPAKRKIEHAAETTVAAGKK
ncbi:hypothetical protein BGZ75_004614 [Mortierella antarctica]|nr:hypothetical protein BGZ75_004614 [Mortierella antarctica]